MMMNQEIAEIFDRMARVLALKGKDRFRALAYERAAGSLRGIEQDLTELARQKKLRNAREPVEFNFRQVVKATVAAGVALEVNGSPNRLDLNDVMTRAAHEAGSLLAIDSDAHSTAQLAQTSYGVSQARPAWVEARSVVNTWPWPKFSRWMRHRRQPAGEEIE